MRKILLSAFVAVLAITSVSAQWCGTSSTADMIQNDPILTADQRAQMLADIPQIKASELKFNEKFKNGERKADKVTIPLVVHILHQGGEENISDEDVRWTVDQINLDFAQNNPNRDEVVAAFQDRIGDMEMEFRLVTIDPDGNCTNGIIRHSVPNAYFQNQNNLIEGYKEDFNWPVDQYFNIYVVGSIGCDGGSCTLGYAYPPVYVNYPGARNRYGFVTVASDFMKGPGTTRGVGTHEIGHNFNLSHTWGPNNNAGEPGSCSTDDDVDDTPLTIGSLSTCNKSIVNCGSLDNVQNYMDYSFCFANFTLGQKDRMHAAIQQYLSNLVSPSNLVEVGADYTSIEDLTALCEANFEVEQQSEVVVCPGTQVGFADLSFYNPTSWSWTFDGGSPATSTDQNPLVSYDTPGEYAVSLSVTNSSGTITKTVNKMVKVVEDLGKVFPIVESFEGYSSINDQSLFKVANPDGNNAFEVTNAAGATGSNSIVLQNFGEGANNYDALMSNKLDISDYEKATDMRFTFKYAFAGRNSGHTDELRVSYSDDCGETWKTRKTLTGVGLETASATNGAFVPNGAGEWKETSVTIIGVTLNSDFRIRFEFESSEDGNNLYLDDINVYQKGEVGINEQAQLSNSIRVFPIPAKEYAKVNIQVEKTAVYALDVVDITGRVIEAVSNNTLTVGAHTLNINVANYTNGVYFIRVKANNESVVKRLVVSK